MYSKHKPERPWKIILHFFNQKPLSLIIVIIMGMFKKGNNRNFNLFQVSVS